MTGWDLIRTTLHRVSVMQFCLRGRPIITTALSALALGACTDATAPRSTAAPDNPALATSGGSPASASSWVVRFEGNGVPENFAAEVARLGGEVTFAHPAGLAVVAGLDDARAGALSKVSGVAAVDPDAYITLDETVSEVAEAASDGNETGVASPSNPTTALVYPRQWNMRAVRADAAWAAGELGSPAVRVGILDTGIDYLHPDLYGRVDLAASRSYLSAAENARVPSGAHLVADLNYHGTHVAATVASNALVAAGVTSRVTLVGMKVCTPGTPANNFTGVCALSSIVPAMLDAADMGLDVITMSIAGVFQRFEASGRGGTGPSELATFNRGFSYVRQKGTTIVVAAGNWSFDLNRNVIPWEEGTVTVPGLFEVFCNVPGAICVSATGPTAQASVNGPWTDVDALAPYSNYGRGAIDAAAPGGNVARVWAACSGFTLVPGLAGCRNRFYNPVTGAWSASVIGINGTSMATPHVAGTAALIAGLVGRSPSQIEARLEQTADDLGQPGTDPAYGRGRINVARAVGVP